MCLENFSVFAVLFKPGYIRLFDSSGPERIISALFLRDLIFGLERTVLSLWIWKSEFSLKICSFQLHSGAYAQSALAASFSLIRDTKWDSAFLDLDLGWPETIINHINTRLIF